LCAELAFDERMTALEAAPNIAPDRRTPAC